MTDGRRLRCNGCRARVAQSDAYEHFKECGATLSYPYRPDRVDTEEMTLEEFV